MSTLIKHDPYSRGAYRRFTWGQRTKPRTARAKCAWCGGKPSRLFNYQWESDAATRETFAVGPWFCNHGCYTSYSS